MRSYEVFAKQKKKKCPDKYYLYTYRYGLKAGSKSYMAQKLAHIWTQLQPGLSRMCSLYNVFSIQCVLSRMYRMCFL